MPKLKLKSSTQLLNRQLKNKEFKKEYDDSEGEFLLAKQIIQLRLDASLTQKELAEKVGTSQSAIARLESGVYRNLTLSFLNRVGQALGMIPHIEFVRKKLSTLSFDIADKRVRI